MKYLLDFDHTLFDTDAFVRAVRLSGTKIPLVSEEIWGEFVAADYLHNDTLDFLKSKNPTDIIILTMVTVSYGELAFPFQKRKVEQEPILSHVQEIEYVDDVKGPRAAEIAKQFPPEEPIVFVDDHIEQCLSVKQHVPQCRCFLLVRDRSVIGDVKSIQDIEVVHSLQEVDDRIQTP